MRMAHDSTQFLYVSTYFIQYDVFGIPFLDALRESSRRGVRVTLLIDDFGQSLASNLMSRDERARLKRTFEQLRASGVHLVFYRCPRRLQRLLGSGMHIKIQLSDLGGAVFSSSNISSTSFERWQEFGVYVEGDIVLRLLEDFQTLGVKLPAAHRSVLTARAQKASTTQWLGYSSAHPSHDDHWLNPLLLRSGNDLTAYLERLFSSARDHIQASSLYFKPAPVLLNAMIQAARRGVHVEIFHSHRDALGPTITPWLPSALLYRRLLDAGVQIYESMPGDHSKVILIDRHEALFGSYNLEHAAHDRLAEAMMSSNDQHVIETIEQFFSQKRSSRESKRIHANEQLPLKIRLQMSLAKYIARWI